MQMENTQDLLQRHLEAVLSLLDKQRLVSTLVHSQQQPRADLVETLVRRQHSVELRGKLRKLHDADIAHILELLPLEERKLVWQHLEGAQAAEVFLELSAPVREFLIGSMEQDDVAQLLSYIDADDLSYIKDSLPEAALAERSKSLTSEDQRWLQSAGSYAEDCVGALMSNDMVTVRENQTLAQAQQLLRQSENLPIHNDKMFVLDARGLLTGVLPLQTILLKDPGARVADVMARDVVRFQPESPAAEAAGAFERYDLVSAPVVNERGKLLGRLTVDVVMDFIRAQSSDDVINMMGVRGQEDLFAPIVASARNRGTWLIVNLLTGFVAATIIGMFADTILHVVALAALMPVIASVGGNTGNQTTALIIRGMARGQVGKGNLRKLLFKEIQVGMLNGLALGLIVALAALIFYHSLQLSLVIVIAMIITLMIAAIVGFLVPVLLEKFGRDPALGSSVLLTASTDSLAFFIFLGLATLLLP